MSRQSQAKTMDKDEVKQGLQDALDNQEHVKHPDEILRPEEGVIVAPLFEEGEDEDENNGRYDGDS
jgi:hypothetical protein